MSDWKPIATAPKDNRRVIVLAGGVVLLARRIPGEMGAYDKPEYYSLTHPAPNDTDYLFGALVHPTDWQPWPEPPK